MLFLSGDTIDVDIDNEVFSPSPQPKTPVQHEMQIGKTYNSRKSRESK